VRRGEGHGVWFGLELFKDSGCTLTIIGTTLSYAVVL